MLRLKSVVLGGLLLCLLFSGRGWASVSIAIQPSAVGQESVAGQESAAEQDDDTELLTLISEWLTGSDADLRTLAWEQVRTDVPGVSATQHFAGLLESLDPAAQAGLLLALAQRGDGAARPAVVALLNQTEDRAVKLAAIRAIEQLGTAEDLPLLIAALDHEDPELRAAASGSLTRIQGPDVNAALGRQILGSGPSAIRTSLIEIVTSRRALDLVPQLLELTEETESSVRQAALLALGQLASPDDVPDLVPAVIRATAGAQREAVEKAILAIYQRHPELAEDVKHPLLDTFLQLSGDDQAALLPALGRVGGQPAREVVGWYVHHPYPFVKEVGIRAVCLWPDASVADQLLGWVRQPLNPGHRDRALKALIRVAGLADENRDDQQRLEWLQQAMELAEDTQQRQLVLRRLSAVRSVESLRYALTFLEQPELAPTVCQTVVELAHLRWLRDEHKDEFMAALDRVQSISQDPIVLDRAQRYKEGKTWTGSGP